MSFFLSLLEVGVGEGKVGKQTTKTNKQKTEKKKKEKKRGSHDGLIAPGRLF